MCEERILGIESPPQLSYAVACLRPLSEQSHQTRACAHSAERRQHGFDRRLAHGIAEHELMSHELDEAGVDENASGDGVKDAVGDERGGRVGVEGFADAEADSNRDRSAEGVSNAEPVRSPAPSLGPRSRGETRAKTQAFECLVEDENDVESDKFGAGDCECETDEDGVEDDTEFEDEDGCQLTGVVFGGVGLLGVLDICVLIGVSEVVLAGNM